LDGNVVGQLLGSPLALVYQPGVVAAVRPLVSGGALLTKQQVTVGVPASPSSHTHAFV
jgi:hypothetical protein